MVSGDSESWLDPFALAPTALTVSVPGVTALYGVTVVKLRPRPSTFAPMVTDTEVWCIDAWMTRTSALLRGVVSRSVRTCSRMPDSGPIPATVYAPPLVTLMVVDRTGLVPAAAPARRMATVYSPLATDWYPD